MTKRKLKALIDYLIMDFSSRKKPTTFLQQLSIELINRKVSVVEGLDYLERIIMFSSRNASEEEIKKLYNNMKEYVERTVQ